MSLAAPSAEATAAPAVMRSPRSVDVEITAGCNLRCRYCSFFDKPEVEYRDLDTAEWLRFFDELGRNAVMDVCVSGGEPFSRKDLRQLLDGIVHNRMRFSLLSNGALIDDAIAGYIAGTGRCDLIQISIDGPRAEIHDRSRGRGAFGGAVRGIRILQEQGVPVTVRVTIQRHNVHELASTARFLLEELKLPAFSTNAAGYLGSGRRHTDELSLSVAERQLAMETLLALQETYPGRIQAQAGPLDDAWRWAQMERARASAAPPFANGGRLSACGCPFNKIAVRADGVIVPCSLLSKVELGKINQDRLDEIWQTAPGLVSLRQRQQIPLSRFALCASCAYSPYCTGNCPGLALSLTGEIDQPSPDACLRRYLDGGGEIVGPCQTEKV